MSSRLFRMPRWPTSGGPRRCYSSIAPTKRRVQRRESIRLLPQFPEAHNLLIRIYQMQGRTKEAAQQAEWLRDYERHKESH